MNSCVYLHKDFDGVVRYVGSGTLARANKTCAKSGRGIPYFDFVNQYGKLNVEIIAKNLTKVDSIDLETSLYLKYSDTALNTKKPSQFLLDIDDSTLSRVEYSEESPTGLVWKIKGNKGSKIIVGTPVGSLDANGYYSTTIENKTYKNHRLIYALIHGKDSVKDCVIDHVDHDRSNNKINNLRAITQAENSRNASKRKRNDDSLPTGVRFKSSNNSFIAYVTDPSRQYKDGANKKIYGHFMISKYENREDALNAAIEFREETLKRINSMLNLGYTDNHGI